MLKWVPEGTLAGAMDLLDTLWWHIQVVRAGERWIVTAGEQRLLVASSEEEANSFIYGLALPYALMPDDIRDELRRRFAP